MATPQSVVYLAPAVAKGSALMEQSNGSSKQLLCLSSVSDASKKTRRICLISPIGAEKESTSSFCDPLILMVISCNH